MKKVFPKISIFLPFYNDSTFIEQSVQACIEQTFTDWELILFDHASTDGSADLVKKIHDPRIRYVRTEENLGAGSGRNIAVNLPLMRGEYVKLLCADDCMKEDCLEELYSYMERNPEKDICFSDMEYIDENNKKLNTFWSKEIPFVNLKNDELNTLKIMFKGHSHLAYPSSFIKKKVLNNLSINNTYIMLFDVSLWTDALINGYKIGFIDKPLIWYRCHSKQMSSIDNLAIASRRGYIEYSSLCEKYFSITDINIVKYLIDSPFAEKLEEGDEDLIPFVIAHYYLTGYKHPADFPSGVEPFKMCGYKKIVEIFDDEYLYRKIINKFGYGIRDFRNFYSYPEYPDAETSTGENEEMQNVIKAFKRHAKDLHGRDLSLVMLSYLLFRKIIRIITLREIIARIKNKKKKKYTV